VCVSKREREREKESERDMCTVGQDANFPGSYFKDNDIMERIDFLVSFAPESLTLLATQH
jgi:hypothetical protein